MSHRTAAGSLAAGGGVAAVTTPQLRRGRAGSGDRSYPGWMAAPTEQHPFRGGNVLVVAFEGWNDAGEAASGAVRAVRDQLGLVTRLEVEPEDYFDYQFNRPTVSMGPDGRRLEWPGVALSGPLEGSGVHVLLGTEPSRGWKTFSAEIVDA